MITEEERLDIIRNACPGAGAAGGMYTANTMASAIEALGMSLPYSSSTLAEDPEKVKECKKAGAALRNLLEADVKPKDIMTRSSFENAMAIVSALGGSTNAVLHLIAIARFVQLCDTEVLAVSSKLVKCGDWLRINYACSMNYPIPA